jgi:hypothetical protein
MKNNILKRFNLLDAAVIVIIIAAIIAVAYRFTPKIQQVTDGGDEAYVMTIVIRNVRQVSADALSKEQMFYDNTDVNNPKPLGELIDTQLEPFQDYIYKTDGTVVLAEVPDKFNVITKVKVTGKMLTDGFYTKERSPLTPMSNLAMTSKYVTTTGQIISIEKMEG